MSDDHLIVLVHGLWGSSSNLEVLDEVLKSTLKEADVGDSKVHTFIPSSFGHFKTYDGIKVIGDYVIQDIFKELEKFKHEGINIKKISFIGYSLGGLIARYCIGELYGVGFFNDIRPIFYSSFATPHLGIKFFTTYGYFATVLNFLGSNFIGQSGKDLFIRGSDILLRMSDKDGKYFKGLNSFKKLICLANIRFDRTVAFYTAYISKYEIFKDWDTIDMKFIQDLPYAVIEDKRIDTKIVDFKSSKRGCKLKDDLSNNENNYGTKKRGYILSFALVLMSFFFPLVFSVSTFATIKSYFRSKCLKEYDCKKEWNTLKLILMDESKNNFDPSETTMLVTDSVEEDEPIADATREIIEDTLNTSRKDISMDNHQQEDDEDVDEVNESKLYTVGIDIKVCCNSEEEAVKNMIRGTDIGDPTNLEITDGVKKLPFDAIREKICDNLNELNWIKLAVFLPSLNAHQSIVARRGFQSTSAAAPLLFLYAYTIKDLLNTDSV